jgi:hypothetical protein
VKKAVDEARITVQEASPEEVTIGEMEKGTKPTRQAGVQVGAYPGTYWPLKMKCLFPRDVSCLLPIQDHRGFAGRIAILLLNPGV